MTSITGVLSGITRAGAVAQGIGQAASNLSGLLSAGMSPLPGGVNIGGIDLHDFEIPEQMPWGTVEELKIHMLPGGSKLIQMMGAAYIPIIWSGMMLGPDAAQRAQLLEQLVWAEQITTLTFGSFQYRGIVKRFKADYRTPFWQGQYEIEFETLPDAPATTDPVDDPSLGAGIAAGQSAIGGALNDVANGLSSVVTTAEGIVSTGQAALNSVASIVTPITNALGVQVPYLTSAQTLLTTAGSAVGALEGAAAGVAAVGVAATSLSTAGSMITAGMQVSGGAMMLTASNAPTGDLLSVSDLSGATTAAGTQANMTGMGYAATYAQSQLPAVPLSQQVTPQNSPSLGWTPVTNPAQIAALNQAFAQP